MTKKGGKKKKDLQEDQITSTNYLSCISQGRVPGIIGRCPQATCCNHPKSAPSSQVFFFVVFDKKHFSIETTCHLRYLVVPSDMRVTKTWVFKIDLEDVFTCIVFLINSVNKDFT